MATNGKDSIAQQMRDKGIKDEVIDKFLYRLVIAAVGGHDLTEFAK